MAENDVMRAVRRNQSSPVVGQTAEQWASVSSTQERQLSQFVHIINWLQKLHNEAAASVSSTKFLHYLFLKPYVTVRYVWASMSLPFLSILQDQIVIGISVSRWHTCWISKITFNRSFSVLLYFRRWCTWGLTSWQDHLQPHIWFF